VPQPLFGPRPPEVATCTHTNTRTHYLFGALLPKSFFEHPSLRRRWPPHSRCRCSRARVASTSVSLLTRPPDLPSICIFSALFAKFKIFSLNPRSFTCRIWFPGRTTRCRRGPAVCRQVLRAPHPVNPARRLGSPQGRLGDRRSNRPRCSQTRSLGRGWHNMQDQLRPRPHC
jgi:hypothetical protein